MSEESFEKGLKLILRNLNDIQNSITLTYIDFEDILLEQSDFPIGYFVEKDREIIGAFKNDPDVTFYKCYMFASRKKGENWKLRNEMQVDYSEGEWVCDECENCIESNQEVSVRLTKDGIYSLCENCKSTKIDFFLKFYLTENLENSKMYRFGYNTYDYHCLKYYVGSFDFLMLNYIDVLDADEFEWESYNYCNFPNKNIIDEKITYTIGFDIPHNDYGPAIKYMNGREEYLVYGNYHRIGGPAIVDPNGYTKWYVRGELHSQNDEPCASYPDGRKEWRYYGRLHRPNDKPALISSNGDQYYFNQGQIHREGDNPSVIFANGDLYYHKWGAPHREGDNPASVCVNGRLEYYKDGKIHREGDNPAIIRETGVLEYFKKGKLHRDGDNPAIEYPNGAKFYCKNGFLHRDGDLPAVINPDPSQTEDLFLEERDNEEPVQFNYNYEYWFDGLRHRKHGLPAVYHRNGEIEEYYVNGEKHNLYDYAIKLKPEGHFEGYNEYRVDGVLVSSHQFEFLQKRFYRTLKEERKLLTEYWCKWFEWLMDMSEDARDPKTNIIRGVKYFEKRMSELGLHFNDSDTPEKFNMKLNKNNYITN